MARKYNTIKKVKRSVKMGGLMFILGILFLIYVAVKLIA